MNFIRRRDTVVRILQLPPETVADNSELDSIFRKMRDVYLADRPRGNENQNNDDKDRRNRPRKLNGVATVDLRGLRCVVISTFAAVTHHGVKEKAPNDQEDDQTNKQGQACGIINKLSRLRKWVKDVLNRANVFGSLGGHSPG